MCRFPALKDPNRASQLISDKYIERARLGKKAPEAKNSTKSEKRTNFCISPDRHTESEAVIRVEKRDSESIVN